VTQDGLLEFPCEFAIKALGRAHPEFEGIVTDIVRHHAPDLSPDAVRLQDSRNRRFCSVTVTIRATDKAQLDAIYQDLVDHAQVIMAL
jgi:putative lipoic acid-binding regulatory protein